MSGNKTLVVLIVGLMALTASFGQELKAGTYTGYAWRGESKGIPFKDATGYIVCKLTLDDNGLIKAARLNVLTMHGDRWVERSNPESMVTIDYDITPTAATVGEKKSNGASMFTILTTDEMGFYAAGVSEKGVGALAIVDAVLRFQFEFKFPAGFDYSAKFGTLTIGAGAIPTKATEDGLVKVTDWNTFKGKTILNVNMYNHVITKYGIFKGLSNNSTIREFMERTGVKFDSMGRPLPTAPVWGFHSNGGWYGNYTAIANYLVGKNAKQLSSLVDWSVEKWKKSINANNFFGVDTVSGATKTVQNSFDAIAGATVRMSRESGAYQRALVDAGILQEKDVIKGRY
ncbi:MAG: hypothetical protein A2Y38_03725 [Spirochaetes bacterium GWB1_59_5]|nr:MAG: hypothetical protein A2Y38_03725 [Spirochaetes bacterium GWB1_59_5]